jgi:hypothetical protein
MNQANIWLMKLIFSRETVCIQVFESYMHVLHAWSWSIFVELVTYNFQHESESLLPEPLTNCMSTTETSNCTVHESYTSGSKE